MVATASKAIFRAMMRQAKQMNDYNFRQYSIRRIKAGFRKNQNLQGDEAKAALEEARNHFSVLERQVVLGKLYPSARSVMEPGP